MIKLKKTLKILAIITISIPFILLTSIHLLNFDKLSQKAIEIINTSLPGKFSIKKFSINLFSGKISAHTITLDDSTSKNIINISKLQVKVDIINLLRGNYRIPSLRADKFFMNLSIDMDNSNNLTKSLSYTNTEKTNIADTSNFDLSQIPLKINDLNIDSLQLKYNQNFNEITVNHGKLSGFCDFSKESKIKLELKKILFKQLDKYQDINSINIDAFITDDTLHIDNILCQIKDSSINIKGKLINLTSSPYLDIILKSNIQLQNMQSFLKIPDLEGQFNLYTKLEGNINSPSVTATIKTNHLKYKKTPLLCNLSATLKDNLVNITSGKFQVLDGKTDIAGYFNIKTMAMHLELNLDRINSHYLTRILPQNTPLMKTSGFLSIKSNNIVTLKDVALKTNLAIQDFQLQNIKEDSLDLNIEIKKNKNKVILKNLTIEATTLKANTSGEYHLNKKLGSIQTNIQANLNILEKFIAIKNIGGNIGLDGKINIKNNFPFGKINIRANNLSYDTIKIKEVGILANLEKDILNIDSCKININEQTFLSVLGKFSESENNFSFTSSPINTNILNPFLPKPLSGSILLTGKGEGSLQNLNIDLNLEMNKIIYDNINFDNIKVFSNFQNQKLKSKISINEEIHINTLFSLPDTLNFSADFENIDISQYSRYFIEHKIKSNIFGKINGNLDIKNFYNGNYQVNFSNFDFDYDSINICKAQNFNISSQNNKLKGNIELTNGNSTLSIEGNSNNLENNNLSAKISSKLVLDDINKVFPIPLDKYSGNLNIEANVSNNNNDLSYKGYLNWKDITLFNTYPFIKIDNSQGKISIDKQMIKIEDIFLESDGGNASIKGVWIHNNFTQQQISANFNFSNFPVVDPERYSLHFNSKMDVVSQNNKSVIKGEVSIIDGLYFKDTEIDLFSLLTSEERTVTTPEESKSDSSQYSLWQNCQLDLKVNSVQPLKIDNNLTTLQLYPDLIVKGNLQNPYLGGSIDIRKGSIYLRDNSFNITHGHIEFSDPYQINPNFDVISQLSLSNYIIFLNLGGSLQKPNLSLRSDPPLDQSSILNLLFTGTLLSSNDNGMGLQYQMYNYLYRNISNKIEKNIGIDKVDIEQTSASKLNIHLKNKVSKDVAVEYDIETGENSSMHTAKIDYRLYQNFFLTGYQNNMGNFGAKLKFMLKFR